MQEVFYYDVKVSWAVFILLNSSEGGQIDFFNGDPKYIDFGNEIKVNYKLLNQNTNLGFIL